MYYEMPDGTIKQVNPFTGTEVWTVPGRGRKPITNRPPTTATKLEHHEPENYCNFCRTNYLNVPPEKARVVLRDGRYEVLPNINTKDYFSTAAEFRRVPNLFEIVTMDYWRLNHGYKLSPANQEWKQRILASPEGRQHIRRVLELKMRLSGRTEQEIAGLTDKDISDLSDAFFGGGHELVIARRHYRAGAEYSSDLCASGNLTPQEHFEYLRFSIAALNDIYANNRYVRYVSVFQNWLAPAGASFDHLHKQLVAVDEWGASVEQEVDLARKNPNIYNELVVNFAAYSNLVFAENDYAVALAEIGHRFPTLAVYSKASNLRPW
jgi:galactose-1-phosphate uridylyltransferase